MHQSGCFYGRITHYYTSGSDLQHLKKRNGTKEKGVPAITLLRYKLGNIFVGKSMYMQQIIGSFKENFSKNTFYRFLNSSKTNWLRFTTLLAADIVNNDLKNLASEERKDVFIIKGKWDACALKLTEESLRSRVCYGGLDLSSTTDITAFVLVFPPLDEDDKYVVLPYFWIPEDTLELRVRRDHVPYDVREKQGFLQTTEGNMIHYSYIEKFIEQLGEKFNIREITFDRAIRCGVKTGTSVYDECGILFI